MNADRRKHYYHHAAAIARSDPLEFQRRYLAGLAIQKLLRVRVSRCRSLESFTSAPIVATSPRVVPIRRRRNA